MGEWMNACGAPAVEETRPWRRGRPENIPCLECLGGQTGCGQPGRNPEPQPGSKREGRREMPRAALNASSQSAV